MAPDVHVIYGDNPLKMVRELFRRLPNLKDLFTPRDTVVLKPNVLIDRASDTGATTDPALTEGVILALKDMGVRDITIAESAWLGAKTPSTFKTCGYTEIAEKYNIPLVVLKKDKFVQVPVSVEESVLKQVKIARTIMDASKIINLPVLKAHCQTKLTCGIKNLMGAVPDSEKRRFHDVELDRAVFELGTLVKPVLNICDAVVGDLTFEEGGTPVRFGRIFLSEDLYAFDCYAANVIGYEPEQIGYLRRFGDHFGNRETYREVPLNQPDEKKDFKAIDYRSRYACRILPKKACCSCLAAVFLALEKRKHVSKDLNFYIGSDITEKDISKDGGHFFIGTCTEPFNERGNYVKGCPPGTVDVLKAIGLAHGR